MCPSVNNDPEMFSIKSSNTADGCSLFCNSRDNAWHIGPLLLTLKTSCESKNPNHYFAQII